MLLIDKGMDSRDLNKKFWLLSSNIYWIIFSTSLQNTQHLFFNKVQFLVFECAFLPDKSNICIF